jgi:hypothetical protein
MRDMRTKSKIIETTWTEYLQYLKDKAAQGQLPSPRPSEKGFWQWFIEHKVKVTSV